MDSARITTIQTTRCTCPIPTAPSTTFALGEELPSSRTARRTFTGTNTCHTVTIHRKQDVHQSVQHLLPRHKPLHRPAIVRRCMIRTIRFISPMPTAPSTTSARTEATSWSRTVHRIFIGINRSRTVTSRRKQDARQPTRRLHPRRQQSLQQPLLRFRNSRRLSGCGRSKPSLPFPKSNRLWSLSSR